MGLLGTLLTTEQIIIHRLIAALKISLSQMKSVTLLNHDTISWSIRVFGVGGLFSFYGKFSLF
jgi:hypothetical protein